MHVCISGPTAVNAAISRPRASPFAVPSRCIACANARGTAAALSEKSFCSRKRRETQMSLAHTVRVQRGPGEPRSLHPSAFPAPRAPQQRHRWRCCQLDPGMMSACRSSALTLQLGQPRRAHRMRRRLRRKQGTPRSARETSGREECFLSASGRGGAGRERHSPWQRLNGGATARDVEFW